MGRKTSNFEDKFLSKIGKIDPRHIHEFLRRLLSRKNFFETVFDHLNEGMIVTDDKLRIVYANRFATILLKWPKDRERHFGDDLAELCPPGDLRDTLEAMRRHPRPVEAYECEFGSDDDRRILLTTMPVHVREKDEAGGRELDTTLWVFILADDTERQRHLEAQARAQRLSSLSMLTSGVAHEIKNPLNSLNIHAQILLEEAQRSEQESGPIDRSRVERGARVILEETERLTQIVDEFIQAARPQSPTMQRQYVNRIVEDLIPLFDPECRRNGIELKIELEHDLPPIDLDASLMFQALRNLLRNAIDALIEKNSSAAEEAWSPAILIRTRLSGDFVTLEVIDNGGGIPEENIEKIFEPYYTTKPRGTGLGLMVASRIVTEHRGSMFVESRQGRGTRFLISLPLTERPVRLLDSPRAVPQTDFAGTA